MLENPAGGRAMVTLNQGDGRYEVACGSTIKMAYVWDRQLPEFQRRGMIFKLYKLSQRALIEGKDGEVR